jgi:hypothetical protein
MWAPVNSIACIYQEYANVLRTICNEINRKGKYDKNTTKKKYGGGDETWRENVEIKRSK